MIMIPCFQMTKNSALAFTSKRRFGPRRLGSSTTVCSQRSSTPSSIRSIYDDDATLSKSPSLSSSVSSLSSSPPSTGPVTERTRYTIDDSVCRPTHPLALQKAVEKACRSIDVYLDRKRISRHTQHAFDVLMAELATTNPIPTTTTTSMMMMDESNNKHNGGGDEDPNIVVNDTVEKNSHILQSLPVILDSGCGTGRSTKILARIHPHHLIIGVDRSFVRLTKEKANRQDRDGDIADSRRRSVGSNNKNNNEDGVEDDEDFNDDITLDLHDDNDVVESSSSSSTSSNRPFCLRVAPNAYLVRAELVDFWRCCLQHELWQGANITHHYMLYPNPYPTNARLTQRWYAHPSLPLLLRLGAGTIIVRSNWENYLTEFANAVQLANDYYTSPKQQQTNNDDWNGEESPIVSSVTCGGSNNDNNNPASPYVVSAKVGPQKRTDTTLPYTNFEAKYDNVGEPTYELILTRESLLLQQEDFGPVAADSI